jgi:hypothetical protein
MDYAFGFGGQAPRKERKAKPRVKAAPQQAVTPLEEAPVVNTAGRWIQDPVTKQWVFQKATQPIIAKSPIVVRMPVRPAHVPAPNMKAMVQPAPRPIRITAQHRTRRGGLTRRNDR